MATNTGERELTAAKLSRPVSHAGMKSEELGYKDGRFGN